MARRLVLAAALVAALLPVAGAGGTNSQTPKRGGAFVIGAIGGGEPACLNVLLERCPATGVSESILHVVLDGAFEVGPDLTYRPRLARVDFTTTAPFTLTYHVRPEARWSDGVPVTARDFVFTQRALERYLPAFDPENLHLTLVRSVRATDGRTVRVVLREKNASWRSLFKYVLPSHVLQGKDLSQVWMDGVDDPDTGRPIGTGPFLVQSWLRGSQIVLVRNPRYWGAHAAYLDRLVYRFFPADADREELFRTGAVDQLGGRVSFTGARVLWTPTLAWEQFSIRIGGGGHPALRSKLVRRALAYGIERIGIQRRLEEEIDPVRLVSQSVMFPPASPYLEPHWARYRRRPDLARRLLEQAECERGTDGVYSCGGRRLTLRFVTTGGVGRREGTLRFVQQQLREIGIEVVPVYVAVPIRDVLDRGDFDAALFFYLRDPLLAGLDQELGCGGGFNFTGYCQRLVTADLDQADRILDADRRAAVLNRADAQLALDVPVIPLWYVTGRVSLRKTVHGYTIYPLPLPWRAEDWWLER